jgi:secreted Zn-dependent insulinase-like peptidase
LRYLLVAFLLCHINAWGVETAGVEVLKGDNDDRQYQYLVLPNKLQVVLVSDPGADRAAVSLNVNVGSG